MKKLVLILLLTILPIQFAWSMAAAYCQHEPAGQAHFGHHSHQHQQLAGDAADPATDPAADDDGAASVTTADDGHPGKPAKTHADCEVCHHAVQAALPGADALVAAIESGAHASLIFSHYHSHVADGPKRPNWRLVA